MLPAMTLVLLLALSAGSCSTRASDPPRTPDRRQGASDPLLNFNGIWVGTSTSDDGDKAKIAFDIKREGNKFKGDYRCAPGNAVCRNNVDRGWVTGQVNARGLRVAMQDTSWCMYFMDEFYPPKADGEYTCYMNGGIADQGTFELTGPPAAPTDQGEAVGKPKP